MSNIKDILNNFIDNRLTKEKYYSCVGQIQSVSLSLKTCSVKLLTDEVVQDVRLETDLSVNASGDVIRKDPSGFVLVPAVNSYVIVTFINKSTAYVSMFSTISKVFVKSELTTFNDGSKGGLINIEDLTGKINSLVRGINTELTKIQTGIVGAGGAYAPVALGTFKKDDYEDTKIIH